MNEIIQSLETNATNGKENFCYISEDKLKALKELSEREYQENQQLKEKKKTYEDPEDLTLMFMYCNEKAKDKIQELEEQLKIKHDGFMASVDESCELAEEIQKYKEVIDKAIMYVNSTRYSDINGLQKYSIKEFWFIKELEDILKEVG